MSSPHPASKNDAAGAGMTHLPGGTFRTGSDHHYPEEARSHLATVDGFRIDATAVTDLLSRGQLAMAEKVDR